MKEVTLDKTLTRLAHNAVLLDRVGTIEYLS